jgi:flagellar FliJ protein
MSWPRSLVKLAAYEVEVLQKRLAGIMERRAAAELRLAMLQAEGEAETPQGADDPLAGLYRGAFMAALRTRKLAAQEEIAAIGLEEQGAREALAEAFESQKKYEHVAEQARLRELRVQARRETAALDEVGLRKIAR